MLRCRSRQIGQDAEECLSSPAHAWSNFGYTFWRSQRWLRSCCSYYSDTQSRWWRSACWDIWGASCLRWRCPPWRPTGSCTPVWMRCRKPRRPGAWTEHSWCQCSASPHRRSSSSAGSWGDLSSRRQCWPGRSPAREETSRRWTRGRWRLWFGCSTLRFATRGTISVSLTRALSYRGWCRTATRFPCHWMWCRLWIPQCCPSLNAPFSLPSKSRWSVTRTVSSQKLTEVELVVIWWMWSRIGSCAKWLLKMREVSWWSSRLGYF